MLVLHLDDVISCVSISIYLIHLFYYYFLSDGPSASPHVQLLLSAGFPGDGTDFAELQSLSRDLSNETMTDDELTYVKAAFGITYIRRQIFSLSGVKALNLLASGLFGFFGGLLSLGFWATYGSTVSFSIAKLAGKYALPLFDRLRKKPGASYSAQELRENGAAVSVEILSESAFKKADLEAKKRRRESHRFQVKKEDAPEVKPGPKVDKKQAVRPIDGSEDSSTRPAPQVPFRSSLALLIFFRLVPGLPSWTLNTVQALMGCSAPEFILSVALGTAPYNAYTLLLGASLGEVTEEGELSSSLLVLLVTLVTLPLFIALLVREGMIFLV